MKRATTLFGAVSLLFGCGGRTEELARSEAPAPAFSAPPRCVPTLGDKAVRHACQHTRQGPFVEIVGHGDRALAEDMSQVHHTYRFVMASERSPFRGYARFRTNRKGIQAFMLPSGVALRFFREDVEIEAIDASAPGCERFEVSSVLRAPSGGTYLVELSSERREFDVFVEHLDAFTEEGAWRTRCDELE